MRAHVSWFFVTTALLTATATGCAATVGEEEGSRRELESAGDSVSSDGLVIDEMSANRVTGTFARREVSVRFDLRRDGDLRHVRIVNSYGKEILDSSLSEGIDSSRLDEGRVALRGDITAPPATEQTARELEAFFSTPEATLVPLLKEALVAAHVDPGLLAHTAAKSDGIAPQKYFDGSYWHLSPYESQTFATWSFWGVTTVMMGSADGWNWAEGTFWVGGSPEYQTVATTRSFRRQWGGRTLYVGNTGRYYRGLIVRTY